MKRSLLTLLACASGLAAAFVSPPVAHAPATSSSARSAPLEDEDETPLETQMLIVQDQFKALRRSLRKPETRADALAQLSTLEAALLIAKDLVPKKAADLPEAERGALVDAYRSETAELLRGVLEVEKLTLAGDTKGASDELKRLRATEDPAHEKYMKDY